MPRNKQLFAAFAIFAIMLVFTGCFLRLAYGAERTERTRMDSDAVSAYVAWFHRNVKKSRLVKAEAVLPYVLKYSEQYNLDPLLVACLISWETSWRPRPGGLGEIGYLQRAGRNRLSPDYASLVSEGLGPQYTRRSNPRRGS
jgi:soluble lytic murein transglycosylase-like protein